MKNKFSTKAVALVLAGGLLAGATVGGTLAWLMDTTSAVTNTFVVGDINIELDESKLLDTGVLETAERVYSNDDYKILPGNNQPKDPVVTVNAGSEACWLFVEVTEKYNYAKNDAGYINSAKKIINWTPNTTPEGPGDGAWKLLTSSSNAPADEVTYVYYINQAALTGEGASNKQYYVLSGSTYTTGEVYYNSQLTKEELDKFDTLKDSNGNSVKPSLVFNAYAIQSESLKAENGTLIDEALIAWKQIKNIPQE